MKTHYKLPASFIKEAHASACDGRKKRIEAEVPELFKKPELEVGKWYKNRQKSLVCLTGFNQEGKPTGYGINYSGYWLNDDPIIGWNNERLKPATDSEVSEALINEAKRRGLIVNAKFTPVRALSISNTIYGYAWNGKTLYSAKEGDGGSVLFENGIWATIIPQPIAHTLKEISEKFGYEVIVKGE